MSLKGILLISVKGTDLHAKLFSKSPGILENARFIVSE